MMEAALSAGLLGLMHKILNCQTAKPLRLDVTALKGARIADGERAANKLLTGAQRCPSLHSLASSHRPATHATFTFMRHWQVHAGLVPAYIRLDVRVCTWRERQIRSQGCCSVQPADACLACTTPPCPLCSRP